MVCPRCGFDTKVFDSRPVKNGKRTRRRRICLSSSCRYRFTTVEEIRYSVRSATGYSQPFSEKKLFRSRSARQGSIDQECLDNLLQLIVTDLFSREVETTVSHLVERVIFRLRQDSMAWALRYAALHLDSSDERRYVERIEIIASSA